MRILAIIGIVAVTAWVVLYVTREAWGEILSDIIAEKVHSAIHDSTPSGPSFVKEFAKMTGKKIIKMELPVF
jgi:hypothetical protein